MNSDITILENNADYPEKDSPWIFYFNGVALPKWGWCWHFIAFDDSRRNWDSDIGPRDIYILQCRIDHVGPVESADPEIFRYTVQEALCILLEKKQSFLEKFNQATDFTASVDEVYGDLIEALFQMLDSTIKNKCAFWTRGYEANRLRLVDAMRRASLPTDNPEYALPPHVRSVRSQLDSIWQYQAKALHRIASSGEFNKEMRKRLLNISAD